MYVQRGGLTEGSMEAQQQAFYANRDFWSHEELQRLHHALRTPGQGGWICNPSAPYGVYAAAFGLLLGLGCLFSCLWCCCCCCCVLSRPAAACCCCGEQELCPDPFLPIVCSGPPSYASSSCGASWCCRGWQYCCARCSIWACSSSSCTFSCSCYW